MPILDRYLYKELILSFVFSLIGLVTFALAISWIDHVSRHNMTWYVIWGFFKYLIPENLVLMTIVAMFLSALVTFNALSRSLELVAMASGGVSTIRIFSPAISLAFAVSTAHLILNDQIAIQAKLKYDQMREKAFHPDYNPNLNPVRFKVSNIWMKVDNKFFNFTSSSENGNEISGVTMFDMRSDYSIKSFTTSQRARHIGDEWYLFNGTEFGFPLRESFPMRRPFDKTPFDFKTTPEEVKQVVPTPNAMQLSELRKYINKNRSAGIDATTMEVEFHYRVALSFACFVFTILALPFSAQSQRHQNLARSISICFLFIIGYWFLFQTLRSMGTSRTIPPLIAAWGANITFGVLAIALLFRRGVIR